MTHTRETSAAYIDTRRDGPHVATRSNIVEVSRYDPSKFKGIIADTSDRLKMLMVVRLQL